VAHENNKASTVIVKALIFQPTHLPIDIPRPSVSHVNKRYGYYVYYINCPRSTTERALIWPVSERSWELKRTLIQVSIIAVCSQVKIAYITTPSLLLGITSVTNAHLAPGNARGLFLHKKIPSLEGYFKKEEQK